MTANAAAPGPSGATRARAIGPRTRLRQERLVGHVSVIGEDGRTEDVGSETWIDIAIVAPSAAEHVAQLDGVDRLTGLERLEQLSRAGV